MKKPDSSTNDWRILSELEAALDSSIDSTIQEWFTKALAPLKLPGDLTRRILGSAQEAAVRARHSNNAIAQLGHIHLLLLIPAGYHAQGGTWGFFRIEKTGNHDPDHTSNEHSIEFYLYLEGYR